jgi:hypothetical protein
MKMKKSKVLWSGMLAMALAFGFVMAACDTGNGTISGRNTDPKKIVITGITGYTDSGSIRVFSNLNDVVNNQPRNAGVGNAKITNGTLSADLTVPSNNTGTSQTKWTGNGTYYILFIPQVDNGYSTRNGRIYVGNDAVPLTYDINESVVTLSYGLFKQYNVWKD